MPPASSLARYGTSLGRPTSGCRDRAAPPGSSVRRGCGHAPAGRSQSRPPQAAPGPGPAVSSRIVTRSVRGLRLSRRTRTCCGHGGAMSRRPPAVCGHSRILSRPPSRGGSPGTPPHASRTAGAPQSGLTGRGTPHPSRSRSSSTSLARCPGRCPTQAAPGPTLPHRRDRGRPLTAQPQAARGTRQSRPPRAGGPRRSGRRPASRGFPVVPVPARCTRAPRIGAALASAPPRAAGLLRKTSVPGTWSAATSILGAQPASPAPRQARRCTRTPSRGRGNRQGRPPGGPPAPCPRPAPCCLRRRCASGLRPARPHPLRRHRHRRPLTPRRAPRRQRRQVPHRPRAPLRTALASPGGGSGLVNPAERRMNWRSRTRSPCRRSAQRSRRPPAQRRRRPPAQRRCRPPAQRRRRNLALTRRGYETCSSRSCGRSQNRRARRVAAARSMIVVTSYAESALDLPRSWIGRVF
jgi:hypothetical protein